MLEIGCTKVGKTFSTLLFGLLSISNHRGVWGCVCVGQQKGLLLITALHEFLIVLLLLLLKIR